MNIKHFEAQLKALCPEKFGENGFLPKEIQQEWINAVKENIIELSGEDWDYISETLSRFEIKGIDNKVIIASASILATNSDADMNTDIGSNVCFMLYSKKKKELNIQ